MTDKVQIKTRMNQVSLTRLAEQFGPQLVEVFAQLEQAMIAAGGVSFTGNVSFLDATDLPKDGELVPSIHFSLQPFFSNLSTPLDFEDESDD